MKYYLWMKQKDKGCDYTIECGEILVPLESTDLFEIMDEVIDKFKYYGVLSPDNRLSDCKILIDQEGLPVTSWYESYVYNELNECRNKDNEKKLEKLNKLAEELGVEIVKK